jgi:hypothetical protein
MIWTIVGAYLSAGILVAVFMAIWGATATDHAAEGSGLGFRLVIFPGVALLWPYLILRLLSGRKINAAVWREEESSK